MSLAVDVKAWWYPMSVEILTWVINNFHKCLVLKYLLPHVPGYWERASENNFKLLLEVGDIFSLNQIFYERTYLCTTLCFLHNI